MIGGAARRDIRRILVAGGLGLLVCGAFGGVAGAATSAPFTDPNAVGTIGLCNQAGQQITSGSTTTAPFAWLAVSTTPAQAPYNNASRTAILLAYQPQNGLPPGEWSGAELTASSRYTNPDGPMAAATSGDDSLADYMSNYHPRWDGFLQLRMYLGTADAVQYSLHYPSLDIQVEGNTWIAVGGGPVNCKAGTAESLESIVLPSTTTTAPSSGTAGGMATGAAGSGSGSGSPSTSHATGSASSPGSSPTTGGVATATGSGSSLGWLVPVLVVLLLAVAAWLVVRRRRPDPAGGTTGTDPTDPEAGDAGPGSGQPSTDVTDPGAADQGSLQTEQTVSSSSSASGTSMKGRHL